MTLGTANEVVITYDFVSRIEVVLGEVGLVKHCELCGTVLLEVRDENVLDLRYVEELEKPLVRAENFSTHFQNKLMTWLQVTIREELSSMSFEDLQKLKERLGVKVYNQTIFGVKKEKPPAEFKRANKNRPREESSKVKVPMLREIIPIRKNVVRDPRFDSSCGTFNEEAFNNAYSFIKDIKQNEKQELYKELRKTPNQDRKKEIKYLIQRIENQEREEKLKQKKKEKLQLEKEEQIESLRQGKKPRFIKKSERKVLDLVERYEELKETGKLKKHIEKRNKKLLNKDRKRYTLDNL